MDSLRLVLVLLIDEGFTTFDLADHYGPAEDYVGFFSKGRLSSSLSKECQVRVNYFYLTSSND